MYYVVRLAGINQQRKHEVFPVLWMRNCEDQLEKFIERRINKNQVHIFFWSNEVNIHGEPNMDVQPNFDLPIQKTFPPGVDGCFYGQPIKFFCKYVDAVAHKNRLRSMEPGLYNVNRLFEAPLPDLNQKTVDPNSEDENSNDNIQTNLSNNEEEQPNDQDDSVASFDELFVSSSSDNVPNNESTNTNEMSESHHAVASSSNPVPCDTSVRDENEIKPELHLLQRADLAEINAFLNSDGEDSAQEDVAEAIEGNDSDSSDGIEFVVLSDNFPQPVQYSCDGLLKQEDDPVSGNVAYCDAPQVRICISTRCLLVLLIVSNNLFTEKWKSHLQGRFKNDRNKEKHHRQNT